MGGTGVGYCGMRVLEWKLWNEGTGVGYCGMGYWEGAVCKIINKPTQI